MPALLATGDYLTVREFMAHSLVGAALRDDGVRVGIATFWQGPVGSWKTDDGHCHSSLNVS